MNTYSALLDSRCKKRLYKFMECRPTSALILPTPVQSAGRIWVKFGRNGGDTGQFRPPSGQICPKFGRIRPISAKLARHRTISANFDRCFGQIRLGMDQCWTKLARNRNRPTLDRNRPNLARIRPNLVRTRPALTKVGPESCRNRPSLARTPRSLARDRPILARHGQLQPELARRRPNSSRARPRPAGFRPNLGHLGGERNLSWNLCSATSCIVQVRALGVVVRAGIRLIKLGTGHERPR